MNKSMSKIEKFMRCEIYLTQKQLEKECEQGPHHGGVCFDYGNKDSSNKSLGVNKRSASKGTKKKIK